MCLVQKTEHFGTQEKGSFQPPGGFGTEVRSRAVGFSLNFRAKSLARNNYQQFSTLNKRCYRRRVFRNALRCIAHAISATNY